MSRSRDLLLRALEHMQEGDGGWDAELVADIANHVAIPEMSPADTRLALEKAIEELARVQVLLSNQEQYLKEAKADRRTGFINLYKSESGYRGGHIWGTREDADKNREKDWVDCVSVDFRFEVKS